MYNTPQNSWDGYTSVVMINNTWANSGGWNDTSFGYPKQVSYEKATNHGWNAGAAWSQVRRVGENIEFKFTLANNLTVAVFEKFIVFEISGYTDQFLLGLTNKDKGYYLFYKNIHTGGLDTVSLHVSGTTPGGTAGDGVDCPINNRFEDRSPGNEIMLFPFLFGRYVDRVSTEKRLYYGDRPNEADNLIMVNRESIGEYAVTNTRSFFDEIKIGSDIYTRVKGPIFSKCSMIVADDPTMNYID